MAGHKDLEAWKQAIALAKAVYELTASSPRSETHGLVYQMRRSAVSISSNIAEGAARNTDNEFIHFLYIAIGSLAELGTEYILSKELQLTGGSAKIESTIEDAGKMTMGVIKYLKNKRENPYGIVNVLMSV